MSVKAQDNTQKALLSQARKDLQGTHFKEALDVVERILVLDPDHVEALNMGGAAAWQGGNTGRALELLDQAMQKHPSHPDAYLNLGVILEQHGQTKEAIDAYTASLEADPNQVLARLNLGNAFAHLGQARSAIEAYDLVLKKDPINVDALCNKGLTLKNAGEMDLAEATLRRAVQVAPTAEQAWANFALVLRMTGKPDEAFHAYEQALKINPTSPKTLNNLAVLHRWQGNLEQAESICRSVLKTHPDVVEVLNNLGDILQAQGRLDEARTAFDRVLTLDPAHPEGHHNLAVLLLLSGDFKNGWRHYEWRWLAKDFPSERRNFPQPMWAGEALAGQTILLYVEQGLGDAIQFVRYAAMVEARGGKVVVECPRPLKRLFETVNGVDHVVARGNELPKFDVQCPFLSLPGLLSPDLQQIPHNVPYFSLSDEEAQVWHQRLKDCDGLKIGLVWAGSPHHTNDRERSIALDLYAPLADVAGCTFVNLQIGPSSEQVQNASFPLIDLTADIVDYADTAALVSQLDLIITVDTSVAHVAGALGKPVWVLLPQAPDWRWLVNREDSPWYPTMKLYRQPKRRDWASVLGRVKDDLQKMADLS